jgi:TRAP-type uncharacterized transport system substrate-binding protein
MERSTAVFRFKARSRQTDLTAILIGRRDLPDERVERLLTGLFQLVEEVAQENLRVGLLSPRTASEGLTLPLHSAAQRYLNR